MKIGELQQLEVSRISDFGLYLKDTEGVEVLLPNRYVSLENKEGDMIEVFVYHDSEDRLVATTETPKIKATEVAYLKVVDKSIHGAFLDWGLTGKDLFLPNRNQQGGVVVGRSYIVYMYVDNITNRCVATEKLKTYVNNSDVVALAVGREVDILIASESEIGYRAIIENRYWGMLYKNQIFRPVHIGEHMRAFVARVTEDNRVDLSLQRRGVEEVRDCSSRLRSLLDEAGGFLPLSDDSTPESITALTQMSKKSFKRAVGMLLKSGEVEFCDGGVKKIK